MKKRPIAMRCNREQFEAIKPKLEEAGINTNIIYLFSYLVLSEEYGLDSFNVLSTLKNREIYETWNEQIFLEACGIEVEKPINVFEISREQIESLRCVMNISSCNNGIEFLKQWFPSAFEEEKKEVGLDDDFTGWVKSNIQGNEIWTMYFENGYLKHGIDSNGMWFLPNGTACVRSTNRKATLKEVEEALINEAKKRYKEGDCFKCFNQDEFIKLDTEFKTVFIETEGFWHGGGVVMKNGIWAELAKKEIQHNGLTYVLKK